MSIDPDENGMVFVHESMFVSKGLVYGVLVMRKVKESDFCPHLEYRGCEQCAEEYERMIRDQYQEYYAGLF